MKKIVLLLLLLPVFANGQFNYWGPVIANTTFTFSSTDSLIHYSPYVNYADSPTLVIIDTSGATLWQIGNTLKPVFSNDTTAARGIMTDTMHYYPANANDFFTLKILQPYNCIVDFWHKYQTDSSHAGGMVEFSTDSGATWINVVNCSGIGVQNFYSSTDTLISGQAAFTGAGNGEQYSRFQLMNCAAERTTATSCFPNFGYELAPIYIRFRFVSDTTTDTLSGWMIDSIEVEFTGCGEGINTITAQNSIDIYPNPTYNELTITASENISSVVITNLIGQNVYTNNYTAAQVSIDVAGLPTGIYFVKVNNTEVRKFVKE